MRGKLKVAMGGGEREIQRVLQFPKNTPMGEEVKWLLKGGWAFFGFDIDGHNHRGIMRTCSIWSLKI